MNTLLALRRVVLANRDPENASEVRSYIEEHVDELAHDLGVTPETITKTLAGVSDDSMLATKMLDAVKKAETSRRDLKKDGRARSAQAAADTLASKAVSDGERVQLDLLAILASVLTKRQDLIVFTTEDFSVSVYQAPLFDLAKVRLRDVTGFVDAGGLHVRWRDGRGGLDLRPQIDPHAERVVLRLSPKKAEAA